MGKLFPQLVSKRPELLNRLASRGTAPLMATLATSGFNIANTQRLANEALAAEHGLRAVYNAAQVGEQTVRTTQGFQYGGSFGEIFRRSGSNAANMNVAYIDDLAHAAGRASAIADETITRGQGITDAYQYVRLPAERFSAFGPVTDALKNVWRGISQASQATTAFSFLPLDSMKKTLENYMLENIGYDVSQNIDI
jgi:hypothetical protein